MNHSAMRVVFNSIVAVCIVMAIGLMAEWYLAGGKDVQATIAVLRQIPRAIWIISGILVFFTVFIFLVRQFFGSLEQKDQGLPDFSPRHRKGSPHSHH